ncbi:NUDIX domain-containing protein [Alteriqipengyuania sp. 357]
MENIPTYLPVVAAAIGPDGAGQWLMHRRPQGKQHGGLWEFPGGKIDPGEGARSALAREIAEECGIVLDTDAMREAAFAADEASTAGLGRPILLLLYACARWQGQARSLEGGEWRWFSPDEIMGLEKPPLDGQLAAQVFAKVHVPGQEQAGQST